MKFLYCYCRPPSHDGRRLAGLLFFNCLSSDDHHIEKPVLCIGAGSNIHFNHKSIPEQIVIDRTRHAIIQISPCIFYHQLPSSPPNCYQTLMGLILCQVALFICNNCTTAYRRRKFTYIHHAQVHLYSRSSFGQYVTIIILFARKDCGNKCYYRNHSISDVKDAQKVSNFIAVVFLCYPSYCFIYLL